MSRVGQHWTKEEDKELAENYEALRAKSDGNVDIYAIAKLHERSGLAITYRLQHLGLIPVATSGNSYGKFNKYVPTRSHLHPEHNIIDNVNDTGNDATVLKNNAHTKNTPVSVLWLYVLQLESGKYYVGTTKDLSRRLEEHWSGIDSSAWTKKYPPVSDDVHITRNKTPLDEDAKVKELMLKYGIDNVRGGSYSQCTLSIDQILAINSELNHARGGCFKCHSQDHWAKDCTVSINNNNVVVIDNNTLINTPINNSPDTSTTAVVQVTVQNPQNSNCCIQ
jgi:predicted GIY-YIG superfamily endonuclease